MHVLNKPKRKRLVYMDCAAATPLDLRVFSSMKPFMQMEYANPSALYHAAQNARKAVEQARALIAQILRTTPDTILFTSGGTESCNTAVLGSVHATMKTRKQVHILTSMTEHHAVLAPIQYLEKQGVAVTYLSVDSTGMISPDALKKALRPETVLVSLSYANNEIGTVYPIPDIGRVILAHRKKYKHAYPYLHIDACQATTELDLRVDTLHADFMSVNGAKMYGPKGIGVLFRRRGVPLSPLLHGGGQEFGLRAGTEYVAGIVGCAQALSFAQAEKEIHTRTVAALRDQLWHGITNTIPNVSFTGAPLQQGARLSNNLNVTFAGADAEALLLYVDAYGISCASGAACAAEQESGSHVLRACGLTEAQAKSSIRFTLGRMTTAKDIRYVLRYLPDIVALSRKSTS